MEKNMQVLSDRQIITEPDAHASALRGCEHENGSLNVQALARGCEAEALSYLAARPLHTVYMAGLIHDNGLVSAHNRGTFYACREANGQVAGLALIGHVTQIEARTQAAIKAIARVAQQCASAHVIMGLPAEVHAFWQHYAEAGQAQRLVCRELLLEQHWPIEMAAAVPELRPATDDELPLVLPVQAQMAEDECGVNPLAVDPTGFRARCARRIARGRTWVVVEHGRLIFKAEIMAETTAAIYLEGIYVNAQTRGRGYGRRCLQQLGRILLTRSRAICLLVHEQRKEAQAFYLKAGYRVHCLYDTIYLYQG
jgi:uncharacterized protein